MAELLLYTRAGCCLCDGLAERLRALDPPLPFRPVDVDADPGLQARYGLQVPVLALAGGEDGEGNGAGAVRALPPVPPRLAGERLQRWLRNQGVCAERRGGLTPT